jgi:hypothetical protein
MLLLTTSTIALNVRVAKGNPVEIGDEEFERLVTAERRKVKMVR